MHSHDMLLYSDASKLFGQKGSKENKICMRLFVLNFELKTSVKKERNLFSPFFFVFVLFGFYVLRAHKTTPATTTKQCLVGKRMKTLILKISRRCFPLCVSLRKKIMRKRKIFFSSELHKATNR